MQREVLNQSRLLGKWVDAGRSDYQAEVQFSETGKLSSRGTYRIKHEGFMRKITLDCSLRNEKTIWHRRKGTLGLNAREEVEY